MKKFWNSASSGDIYIYGDIVGSAWREDDMTARAFAAELAKFKGQAVTVHINSGGGDIFSAVAIGNEIRNHGNVTISIDGLAASAASLIAVSGQTVKMANNAMLVIHAPHVGVFEFVDEKTLELISKALNALKQAVIATYSRRATNLNMEELLETETWFNAEEAKAAGLIDEITGDVMLQFDNKSQKIYVNSLAIDARRFDKDKIQAAMTGGTASLSRLQELERLRGGDLENALIDTAIRENLNAKDVKPFLNAIKNLQGSSLTQRYSAMISEQIRSTNGVTAGFNSPENQSDRIAAYANEKLKGR